MEFKLIATYDNYMLANMALGMLQENNINCHLKDEYVVTIDPFLSPAVGGIKLMIEEADTNRALLLLKEAEADYIKDLPCPRCKSHSLVIEEKSNTPESFWGKLKNQIAYGQTQTYSKKYRCQNCKMLYAELPASF
jgi:Putative prokaryotic signal transducing protein